MESQAVELLGAVHAGAHVAPGQREHDTIPSAEAVSALVVFAYCFALRLGA